MPRFDSFDGGAEAVEIEVVERDAGGAEVEGGFELLGGADQQVELARVSAASRSGAGGRATQGELRRRRLDRGGRLAFGAACNCFHRFAADLIQQRRRAQKGEPSMIERRVRPVRMACCRAGRTDRAGTRRSCARFCAAAASVRDLTVDVISGRSTATIRCDSGSPSRAVTCTSTRLLCDGPGGIDVRADGAGPVRDRACARPGRRGRMRSKRQRAVAEAQFERSCAVAASS